MAFAIANFAAVGNTSKPLTGFGTSSLVGAPSVWAYATNDTVADVNTASYFDGAVRHVNQGDLIYAVCDTDGTPAPVLLYVNSVDKSAGTVDVADGTTISVTDTD